MPDYWGQIKQKTTLNDDDFMEKKFFKCIIKLLSMNGKKILHGIFGYGKIKMVSAHPTALDIQIEG